MKYQAITIDTQTVCANGLQLNNGVVGQLDQYLEGPIKLVLSEVVLREIHRKLAEEAKRPIDDLSRSIREGKSRQLFSEQQQKDLESVLADAASPRDHARSQLAEFVAKTGAKIVDAEKVSIKQLLDAYFGHNPPFSTKGKKDEFPDAIALLTLEMWAKSENAPILAVSNDADWKAFAAKSNWIDCVEDLSTAMNMLLVEVEQIEKQAKAVIQDIIDGNRADDHKVIWDALERATPLESPRIEYSSSMGAQDEFSNTFFVDFVFANRNAANLEVRAIRATHESFVVEVPIELSIRVEVDFTFFAYDSIDGDDIPMGSTTIDREAEVAASILIHFEMLKVSEEDGVPTIDFVVTDVELAQFPNTFDVGYVDYSIADDEYGYDANDWKPTEVVDESRDQSIDDF